MMTRRTDSFVLMLLVAVALMVGCGEGRTPRALVLADSLMNSRPDSALAVLEGAEGQMAGESKSVRMRYQLLRHQAMNKAFVPFTSDSLMLDVTDYYDRHGNTNERMLAHYLLGCVYRDVREAPKALSAYHDAVDCADTTATDCDFKLLSRIHGQMATLMINMQLPYEALEESKTAEILAYRSKDTIMAISCYMLRANAYYLIGIPDSVAIISENVSKMFLQKDDTLYSLISLKPAISAYMDMGRLDSSKEAMNRYERISLLFPINIANYSKRNFEIIKARYFLLRHQFDSAYYYHEQAQENARTPEDKLHVLRGLARYYTQQGVADSAIKYSEQFVAMDDTLYRTSIREDFQKMHNLYNYERSERLAEQKGRELSELKSRVISYILLLFVIVVLAIALIMRRKRKMDAEHRELNKKYAESLEHYAKIKEETALLEQSKEANEMLIEQLQREKDKNAETISKLNSKIEKYSATIKQNKENLKKQEFIIASFQKDKKEPNQWNMEERLFNLPLLTRLHANIAIGKQPSDGQFQEVQEMVEQMLPGFIARILELYPEINHVNLLFCIFTKLRFINSERAVIFNMSSQAVTNRSAFLYNKLTGKKGGAGDFEKEIQKI